MDSWGFEDTADGWTLRVTPRVPFRFFGPRTALDWVFAVGFVVVLASLMALNIFDESARGQITHRPSPLSMVFALVISIGGAVFTWKQFPWPFVHRYRLANAVQRVSVNGGKFENSTGVFDVECLRTMRLTADRAVPGRLLILVTGSSGMDSVVVGWPGISQESAVAIRATILRWLDAGAKGSITAVLTSASS